MNESLVTLSTKRSATLKMWSELKCSRLAYKIEAHKILLRQFFRDFLFDEPTGAGVTLDSTGTTLFLVLPISEGWEGWVFASEQPGLTKHVVNKDKLSQQPDLKFCVYFLVCYRSLRTHQSSEPYLSKPTTVYIFDAIPGLAWQIECTGSLPGLNKLLSGVKFELPDVPEVCARSDSHIRARRNVCTLTRIDDA
eukprot:1180997-Prorocentrum_minimum.AAC.5